MARVRATLFVIAAAAVIATARPAECQVASPFVNFESPVVHPVDLSPDGDTLGVVNLPDNRIEFFDLSTGVPVGAGFANVGLDPVTVRFRSAGEVWVVNHISDTVSIVDVASRRVIETLHTLDEPADVVFAGNPERAFVSCSQANTVQVFDAATRAHVMDLDILGEDPRALAVSPMGDVVYAAVFESGNRTTVLRGGISASNPVDRPEGPYGGQNPPPNAGLAFVPAINPALPTPPGVSIIVKKNGAGTWLDDNGGDWSRFVGGDLSSFSGRPAGWDLYDHDIAAIDSASLDVSYVTGLMNACMALAVNPISGRIAVVGTEAINEVRFEPNLTGIFSTVHVAMVDAGILPVTASVVDLNAGHLDYSTSTIAQTMRNLSVGDPRGIVWNEDGTRAYVTGMGSNNLIAIDAAGVRTLATPIELGEGPTGLAHDGARRRLYVLNRFESSISVVDLDTNTELTRVSFFDPTPAAIKIGRKHLYDTHKNSGLGQVACASCHLDGRIDRLAWDLGDPGGEMKSVAGQNLGMDVLVPPTVSIPFEDHHPMKGPMTTQTLQDIIGHEPHHWRGDRDGIEEFAPAFIGLLGDDATLTAGEMQEFEDFLATIAFPPDAFRNFDNTLPDDIDLTGHFARGRFSDDPGGLARGEPLPNGSAQRGLALYINSDEAGGTTRSLDGSLSCAFCHTLPTGAGGDVVRVGNDFVPIPVGPMGEHHLALVSVDQVQHVTMKIPQTRNVYDKVGFEVTQTRSRAGFGFLHDGSSDSISRFVSSSVFDVRNDQEVADLVAFMLSFSGSDLPEAPTTFNLNEVPGPPSLDVHAAVGRQVTLSGAGPIAMFGQGDVVQAMMNLATPLDSRVDLVVHGPKSGVNRGWYFKRLSGRFQSDRGNEDIAPEDLLALAAPGNELTFTVVPRGSGPRIGIDRDGDGWGDRTEIDRGTDPADPASAPVNSTRDWDRYR